MYSLVGGCFSLSPKFLVKDNMDYNAFPRFDPFIWIITFNGVIGNFRGIISYIKRINKMSAKSTEF